MRAIIFLAIALTTAGAALFVVYTIFKAYEDRIAQAQIIEDTTFVIVAYSDLYQGVTITEEDLFAVEIPPHYLYMEGGPESKLFHSAEHVVGRIPKERILANEYIRDERLADKHKGLGLNALIPRGMRAISINIQGGKGLRGFLEPKNYVDVLVTFTPYGSEENETHYLLQAVYVLGVDDRLRKGESEKDEQARKRRGRSVGNVVTLAVTPSQAEEIAHAVSTGSITLVLRNDLDIDTQGPEIGGVTMKQVLGEQEEKPKPKVRKPKKVKPVEKGHQLTIVNGSTKTNWEYNGSGQGLKDSQ